MRREKGCQRAAEQMEQHGCSSRSGTGGWGAGTALHIDLFKCLLACNLVLFFWSFLTEIKKAHEERKSQGKKSISSAKLSLSNLGGFILRQRIQFGSLSSHRKGSHALLPFSLLSKLQLYSLVPTISIPQFLENSLHLEVKSSADKFRPSKSFTPQPSCLKTGKHLWGALIWLLSHSPGLCTSA